MRAIESLMAPKAKRTKKCYARAGEVAHIWAQGDASAHGIYSANTLVTIYDDMSYFYSYSTKIAVLDIKNDVVLISERGYSSTTHKHQGEAQSATRHKTQIYVYDINQSVETNINDAKNSIIALCTKHAKARKADYTAGVFRRLENVKAYADYNSVKISWDTTFDTMDDAVAYFLALTQKEKEAMEKARIKAEKARAKEIKETTALLKAKHDFIEAMNTTFQTNWRANIANTTIEKHFLEEFNELETKAIQIGQRIRKYNTMLRIASDGERIQTSQGAFIPITVAKGLWRRIERGESVDGMSLGHYTINTLKDGILTVGCHEIPFSELEIIAHLLGLDKQSA